jgi:probable phosphoglycerate mutase
VFLVRHGQTDNNVRRVVQGPRIDTELSAMGRRQAQALGRRLASEHLGAVYASPMRRARETAEAIAAVQGLPVRVLDGFTEFDWGVYCGREETGETEQGMRSVFSRWWGGDIDARAPDGENAREAEARVRAAFSAAIAETSDQHPIAIVAHGRILKILLSSLIDGDLRKQEQHPQHNTGVTLIEGRGDVWKVVTKNDTTHRIDLDIAAGSPPGEQNA